MNHKSVRERATNVRHDAAYRRKHPERKAASNAVEKALATGRLKRAPCWACGAEKVEAHHSSYDAEHRLLVVWLCNPHHREAHASV